MTSPDRVVHGDDAAHRVEASFRLRRTFIRRGFPWMATKPDNEDQALVLPPNGSWAARDAVALSGGVIHQYGDRVIIARIPAGTRRSIQGDLASSAVTSDAAILAARNSVDPTGALGLDAFALQRSASYANAKAERLFADEEWDSGGASATDITRQEHIDAVGLANTRSPRLSAGRVGVGVVIVEGPNDVLKFTSLERTTVVAEVQNGLSWLSAGSTPIGISWIYDIRVVTLTVPPGPVTEGFDEKEARWRDPAMTQLGHGSGVAAVEKHVGGIRTTSRADWAFAAFFTKYPVGHFAYAAFGGPRLVMEYGNDGWGPHNIDRVFAQRLRPHLQRVR
jgi:hypothetical protein